MDNVFIHVGYPKSASTALQKHYFSNHPEIFYLGPYNGGRSVSYYNDSIKCAVEVDLRVMKDFRYDEGRVRSAFTACFEEFRQTSNKKAFGFSSESLSFNLHHDVDVTQKAARLHRIFGSQAKIIIVIRDQFSLLRSMYREFVANGLYFSFQRYMQEIFHNMGRSIVFDLNYDKMHELYCGHFGEENVLLLPMEQIQPNSQFLGRISDHMGVERLVDSIDVANGAMSDAFYVALRELNMSHRHMLGASLTEASFQGRYEEYYTQVLQIPTPPHPEFERNVADLLWAQASRISQGSEAILDDSMPSDIERWLGSYYGPANDRLAARTGLPLKELGYL